MLSKKLSFNRKLDTIFSRLLSFFGLINFFLLFLGVRLPEFDLACYTLLVLVIFVIYLFIHESCSRFGWQRILLRSPDILMIIMIMFLKVPIPMFLFYILGRQTMIVIRQRSYASSGYHKKSIIEQMSKNPPGFFMISFILTISLGTMLLMLPAATVSGEGTPFIEALFTATSATCVTGLIVQDTGTYFSLYGQIVILLLIQVGALGIMTISGAFFVIIGQKMKMRSEALIRNVVGESNKFDMMKLLKHIVIVTFSIELLGAVILYWRFSSQFGCGTGTLYKSVFHSVSAFCNAGFSLFEDSLMQWHNDVPVNLIISLLIIIGGLGFPVVIEVTRIIRHKRRIVHLNLHTKIVLMTTIILIIMGTVIFFFSEYNNIMQNFTLKERFLTSYFQSVTTRTAGFNTIDNSLLSDSSILASVFLMFIGASPGSTGGGLKTTTFFILFATVISMFKGRRDTTAFHRKISEIYIKRVLALITASVSLMAVMTFLLLHFENGSFTSIIFEAFSAFGTVGLSMGVTPVLSNNGKIIIIMLMYLGRIGPLTLGYAAIQNVKKTQFDYIEEKINIG
jgi:trk system potassium uptake protein